MRHIFLFLASIISILGGCSPTSTSTTKPDANNVVEEENKREYSEISHLKILWNDIFKQSENHYFVYFYSLYCSHCNSIKNFMIETALRGNVKIYFIQASGEHVINDEIAKETNVDSLENLAIRGYPTLLELSNWIVVKNVAGETAIKSLLNS